MISDHLRAMVSVFLTLLVTCLGLVSLESVKSHGIQPLSLIAIHKVVISIDDKAYIRVSPVVLGLTVSLAVSKLSIR